eukprot:m.80687 g.80687  ORF g.80687 m.80687 type:complete len:275 (+) comp14559_c0_seq1:2107-2931(+)
MIDKGARVDARDGAGFTALNHACCHQKFPKNLVEVLVAAGADVNSRDMAGETCLHRAVMSPDLAGIRYLLANGARADVRDNEGQHALDWAGAMGPAKLAIFREKSRPGYQQPYAEKESAAIFSACHYCQATETKAPLQGCSRCLQAQYCGRDCQAADWNEHKVKCKVWKKELVRLPAESVLGMTNKGQPKEPLTTIVKVQFSGPGPLLIYDKTKKIKIATTSTTPAALKLIASIQENGFVVADTMGKGYFRGRWDPAKKELAVVANRPIPMQSW